MIAILPVLISRKIADGFGQNWGCYSQMHQTMTDLWKKECIMEITCLPMIRMGGSSRKDIANNFDYSVS